MTRRVIIVGAGIMGLCAAWALRRRGCAVTVFEQYDTPNPLGSSFDQHRLIRHPYGAEAGYCRMVDEAYGAWDRLWSDLGASYYEQTGTLVLSTHGKDAWFQASRETLAEMGHRTERLDPAALEARFPMLDAGEVSDAFYLASGGVLFAEPILAALAEHLRANGAVLRCGAKVASIKPDQAGITLADGSSSEADALIVCAGPWVTELLPELRNRVMPSRQILVRMDPPPRFREAWQRAPMVLDIDPGCGFYVVPPVRGTSLKTGDHRFSMGGDPDRDREPTRAEAEQVFALARRRLKDFDQYALTAAKTCFYTVSPDERFVVEPIGASAWVMTGFSGHGFKFGSVLGERMADLVDGTWDSTAAAAWAAGLQTTGLAHA